MVADAEQLLVSREYPLATVFRARSLYLTQGWQPKMIADDLQVPLETVYTWAKIHGWTRLRQESQVNALKPESLAENVRFHLEEAALKSAALVANAVNLAGDALTGGDARTAMFASSAAKNLMDLATKGAGMDKAATVNVNLGFSLEGLYRPPEVNVTPEKPALPAP